MEKYMGRRDPWGKQKSLWHISKTDTRTWCGRLTKGMSTFDGNNPERICLQCREAKVESRK